MKGGSSPQLGFTIVETMIVLVVTLILLFGAALLVSGKVDKAEFQQGTGQFQAQIQQRINEVVSGFYPALPSNLQCQASSLGTGPTFSPRQQASDGDCIFIGKAIQFAVAEPPNPNPSQFNIYTIAALRATPTGQEATSFEELLPVLVAKGNINTNPPNVFDKDFLSGGLKVEGMWYNNENPFVADSPANKIGAVAFISGFGSATTQNTTGTSILQSGTNPVSMYVFRSSTALNDTQEDEVDFMDINLQSTPSMILANSVQICVTEGQGSHESALLSIGTGDTDQLTADLIVKTSYNCS